MASPQRKEVPMIRDEPTHDDRFAALYEQWERTRRPVIWHDG